MRTVQRWGQSTEYGVQRAEQATTGHDPGLLLPPWAEPARDYQRGYTPGLARSVRSPDPTRDKYERPKWPKERQVGPWRRAWGGGRGQAAKTQCKGANRPVACAKVQRLSQISEYGVQSTEGTGGLAKRQPVQLGGGLNSPATSDIALGNWDLSNWAQVTPPR